VLTLFAGGDYVPETALRTAYKKIFDGHEKFVGRHGDPKSSETAEELASEIEPYVTRTKDWRLQRRRLGDRGEIGAARVLRTLVTLERLVLGQVPSDNDLKQLLQARGLSGLATDRLGAEPQ
jgi:hypothetical protein